MRTPEVLKQTPTLPGISALSLLLISGSALATIRVLSGLFAYGGNDNMYIATAMLLADGHKLYEDAAFVQMPLSVLLYQLLFEYVPPIYAYLAAKFASSIAVVLACLTIALATARGIRAPPEFSALLFVLLVANDLVVSGGLEASNYSFPQLGLAVAYWIFVTGFEAGKPDRRRGWRMVSIGLLLGLCISTRLTYLWAALAFPVAMLFMGTRRSELLLDLAGGLIGLAPAVFFLLRDPSLFVDMNLHYHTLANQARGVAGVPALRSLAPGVAYVVLTLVPAVLLCLLNALPGRHSLARSPDSEARPVQSPIVACLLLAGVVTGLSPGIYFPQYWITATSFAIVLVARRLLFPSGAPLRATDPMVVGAILLAAVASTRAINSSTGAISYSVSAPAAAYVSRMVGTELRAATRPDCVTNLLTTRALAALDSGVPLSSGSSAGTFMFRMSAVSQSAPERLRPYFDASRYFVNGTAILFVDGVSSLDASADSALQALALDHRLVECERIAFEKHVLRLFVPRECVRDRAGSHG